MLPGLSIRGSAADSDETYSTFNSMQLGHTDRGLTMNFLLPWNAVALINFLAYLSSDSRNIPLNFSHLIAGIRSVFILDDTYAEIDIEGHKNKILHPFIDLANFLKCTQNCRLFVCLGEREINVRNILVCYHLTAVCKHHSCVLSIKCTLIRCFYTSQT